MLAKASKAAEEKPVEDRIARIESDVGHIKSDVAEIKGDIRELHRKVENMGGSLSAKIEHVDESLLNKIDKLTRDVWGTRIQQLLIAAALLGVMARGFKWL